jgi:uncharacterized membrane protein
MANTIGNPLSWATNSIKDVFSYFGSVTEKLGPEKTASMPEIRQITMGDIRDALRSGFEDFKVFRTDIIFICLLYPIIGFSLVWMAINGNLLHLLFPVISGFALIGPLAAVSLYEMSRRREQSLETSWLALDNVLRSPTFGAIFVLGLLNIAIYIVWLIAADLIYINILGPELPVSADAFMVSVLTTKAGWAMGVIGLGVGFVFAVVVLTISVVSYPLLLDRNVGLPIAVITSVRVSLKNPGPIAAWGLIIAVSLVIGALPLLLGLIFVIPILGHATWHLYRKTVVKEVVSS